MFWREFYGLALASVPPVAPAVSEAVISYRAWNFFIFGRSVICGWHICKRRLCIKYSISEIRKRRPKDVIKDNARVSTPVSTCQRKKEKRKRGRRRNSKKRRIRRERKMGKRHKTDYACWIHIITVIHWSHRTIRMLLRATIAQSLILHRHFARTNAAHTHTLTAHTSTFL